MRIAASVAGGLIALFWVTAAFAHAEPVRVSPGDGAILASPPARIEMVMSQEMARQAGANAIQVFDVAGTEVTKESAVIDNLDRRKLSVALPTGLATGSYTVNWKTVSADDGDPAQGSISFTVDPTRTPSPGKEVLRESPLAPDGQNPAAVGSKLQTNSGVSWVLVLAVVAGTAVIGGGAAFLAVQKRS
jgi:methionine-rich copper-binding protein CopC